MSADAEIVALMYETLTALGLDRFSVRVNNRKILNGLACYVKYDQMLTPDVLRSIDKLDKIKWDGVMGELKEKASFTDEQLSRLKAFLDIRASSTSELLDGLSKLMSDSPEAMKGITELAEISDNLIALGVPEKAWRIDLSVARGLGYYTGPVFETILDDLPGIGSVFSGGRYDDLVARFSERGVSATGASVGVDRLFAAMEQLNLVKREKTTAKVIVLNFDGTAEGYCQNVASIMRRSGLPTELYLGKESNLKGQLAYALGQSVPVIIIAGGSERDRKTVQVKDVARRQQTEMTLDEAPDKIKVILQDSNNVV